MAETKKEAPVKETVKEVKNEKVQLFVPKAGRGEDENYFISVNGKSYLLPRGKTSTVPPEVAAEYNRAVAAQERYDRLVRSMKGR